MTRYEEYIAKRKHEFGSCFTEENLDQRFVPYFNSGEQVKIEACYGMIYGRIGATTGWRPAFLLMHNSRAIGSSVILGSSHHIVAVKRGTKYVPISKGVKS